MSFTQIHREQLVKTDINTLWDFMSSPKNLETITPESMMFKITSKNKDEKMYPGMIITYIVSPLLKIKLTWMTEITQVKEKSFFIDEQRLGPYTMWHHQHIFKQTEEGVLMKDIITYIPPFGIIGKIANFLFIKNKVNQIFNYRNKKIDILFNN
mgnify:FL=1|tara:strand:+ start:1684 stop:2145 length:462 start_codon:yes stop_codon:yes gene_type:complete